MLKIQQQIGWAAFKQTFMDYQNLTVDETNYINGSYSNMKKLNLFLTKLRANSASKPDIINNILTARDRQIITNAYGGNIGYYNAPPIAIGGGVPAASINIAPGKYELRRFIPNVSGYYNVFTSPYGGTGISNDTYIEVYDNDYLAGTPIGENDDYGNSLFSRVQYNFSANQTYYVKIYNFSSYDTVHADLRVTKNVIATVLPPNTPTSVYASSNELKIFSFTPTESGMYQFATSSYSGAPQYDFRDIVLELYSDDKLTKSLVKSKYETNVFPRVVLEMEAGHTYYLTFSGYMGNAAQARINAAQTYNYADMSVSMLSYNGGLGPMSGKGNTLKITLNKPGNNGINSFYIVPMFSWDKDGTYYDKPGANTTAVFSSDTETITFVINGIEFSSPGNGVLYTKIRVYTSNTSMNLITETSYFASPRTKALSNLNVIKEQILTSMISGALVPGRYAFMHNPETVVDDDILQPEKANHVNNLMYKDTSVTGYNSFISSHSTKGTAHSTAYTEAFYYDIDLYNPTSSPITLKLREPYKDVRETWGATGIWALKYLCLERIWNDHNVIDVTIPAKTHKLLFKDIMNNGFLIPYNGSGVFWALFVDLEVPNGTHIEVSELAAYSQNFLELSHDSTGKLQAGTTTKVDVIGAPLLMDERYYEDDLNGKPKGIDNAIPEVRGDLNYVIDDMTESGRLYINNKDPFFLTDIATKQDSWVADINPLSDGNVLADTFPSNLASFKYNDGSNWLFDYKHMKPITQFDPVYMANDGRANYALNSNMLYKYKRFASDSTQITNDEKEYIKQNILSFGGWGVNHVYTIDIRNAGNRARTFKYNLLAGDAIFGSTYNVYNCDTGQYIGNGSKAFAGVEPGDEPQEGNDSRHAFNVATAVLPPNSHYIITVSILPGVGTAGSRNILRID